MTGIRFHHVALPCRDLPTTISWYHDLLGCEPAWETSEFAVSTRQRIPGITRMAELRLAGLRLHIYETRQPDPPAAGQHFCLAVPDAEALSAVRQRAALLAGAPLRISAPPDAARGGWPEVVIDADGVRSIYLTDPDANEFEVTFIPPEVDR